MRKNEIFNVVAMVIEEATERFSPLWRLDKKNYQIFKQYCKGMDVLIKDFDGISFEVEIDEVQMTIKMVLECQNVIITGNKHVYYELASRAVTTGIYTTEAETILLEFVFPSLWKRK